MAKIAVVGCGAMGSVYAALMVDAGHEVHAVTLWPDHAEAMASKGLRCEGASGDRTVPIHASAKIWESAGFKVGLFEDIKQMVWEKLIMNVAFSGTSCTTGLTVGEILGDPDAWGVARAVPKKPSRSRRLRTSA